jgi:hypothetical protein
VPASETCETPKHFAFADCAKFPKVWTQVQGSVTCYRRSRKQQAAHKQDFKELCCIKTCDCILDHETGTWHGHIHLSCLPSCIRIARNAALLHKDSTNAEKSRRPQCYPAKGEKKTQQLGETCRSNVDRSRRRTISVKQFKAPV